MSDPCPICGHVEGACKRAARTNERQIITSAGVVTARKPRVQRQRKTALGRAGYVGERTGEIEIYDPANPHIHFVSDEEMPPPAADIDEAPAEPAETVPRKPTRRSRNGAS